MLLEVLWEAAPGRADALLAEAASSGGGIMRSAQQRSNVTDGATDGRDHWSAKLQTRVVSGLRPLMKLLRLGPHRANWTCTRAPHTAPLIA